EVLDGLRAPKRILFVFAAACGALLYSYNPWFWIKIALLLSIAVNYLIFRWGGRAKLAGGLSLLLWTGVVCAARGPATIKDIMHSMVNPSGEFVFKSVQQIADERGIREKAPQTDAEWEGVRNQLRVLLEAPDLLTAAGRLAARP